MPFSLSSALMVPSPTSVLPSRSCLEYRVSSQKAFLLTGSEQIPFPSLQAGPLLSRTWQDATLI